MTDSKKSSESSPLCQAERALDEITAQEPSRAQVQQANAQLAQAKEGYEQAQDRLAHSARVARAVSARKAEASYVSSPRGWGYERGGGLGLER